ncbi:hypothetical protein ACFX12_035131 [Malus domestica]
MGGKGSWRCATELGDLFVVEPISQIQTPISRPNLLLLPSILLEKHVEAADDDDLSRTKSRVSTVDPFATSSCVLRQLLWVQVLETEAQPSCPSHPSPS